MPHRQPASGHDQGLLDGLEPVPDQTNRRAGSGHGISAGMLSLGVGLGDCGHVRIRLVARCCRRVLADGAVTWRRIDARCDGRWLIDSRGDAPFATGRALVTW